jgi:hypothetical protein
MISLGSEEAKFVWFASSLLEDEKLSVNHQRDVWLTPAESRLLIGCLVLLEIPLVNSFLSKIVNQRVFFLVTSRLVLPTSRAAMKMFLGAFHLGSNHCFLLINSLVPCWMLLLPVTQQGSSWVIFVCWRPTPMPQQRIMLLLFV